MGQLFLFQQAMAQFKSFEKYRQLIADGYSPDFQVKPKVEGEVFNYMYTETLDQIEPQLTFINNVSIFTSLNKYYYYSDMVDVFQDGEDAFMIVHKEKMIFRTNSLAEIADSTRKGRVKELQYRVIREGQILDAKEIELNGKKIFRMVIEPPQDLKNELKTKHVTYWYDLESEYVSRLKVTYLKGYELASRDIRFEKPDYEYHKKMKKPVFRSVLDKKGRLLPQYSGYRLIEKK